MINSSGYIQYEYSVYDPMDAFRDLGFQGFGGQIDTHSMSFPGPLKTNFLL